MIASGGSRACFPCKTIALINLLNPKDNCEILATYIKSWGSVGGLLQNCPIICGGRSIDTAKEVSDYCKVLGKPSIKTFLMLEKRCSASSVVLNHTKLWITGGFSSTTSPYTSHASTEIISLDQSVIQGPTFPFSVFGHSMVQVNSKTIYLIGGLQDKIHSKKTWIVDPSNNYSMKEGPSMNIARFSHSSAKFKINGRDFLVVSGGYKSPMEILNSIELLDTSLPEPKQAWILGKHNLM